MERVGTDENRFENEPDAFYERVYAGYNTIAMREPDRVTTIRSDAPVDAIEREVRDIVMSKLRVRVESVV